MCGGFGSRAILPSVRTSCFQSEGTVLVLRAQRLAGVLTALIYYLNVLWVVGVCVSACLHVCVCVCVGEAILHF